VRPVIRIAAWSIGVFCALLMLAFVSSFFINEPLRRRMEADMNRSLKGYKVEVPYLRFSPIGFTVTIENLTVIQESHPNPPVGCFTKLQASIHWRALMKARLVADFELEQPDIRINLAQLQEEAASKTPVQKRGWQEAVNAIYPLKINFLSVKNGKLSYIDQDPQRPLILSDISLQAANIRNVFSPDRVYPSPFTLTARVFEKGIAEVRGQANFIEEPFPGAQADLNLRAIELSFFRPVLAHYQLAITGGTFAAQGHMEYSPKVKTAHLQSVKIEGIKLDYIHTARTAEAEKERADKAKEAAKEVSNQPGLQLRLDDFYMTGEVGFVDNSKKPSYRLYLDQSDLHLTNLSNHFSEGSAEANLTGAFMGSGKTNIVARFRPENKGPDFDLYIRVVGTQIKSMNDLLRAYADFDVTAGSFSVFMEMHVNNQHVDGYVKPFFKDIKAYSPSQDEEKNLFQKLYEGAIDVIAKLLKNESTQRVATKADISGDLEDPKASTWQVIVNMVRNAFIRVILPGFEGEARSITQESLKIDN
jgi:hypothetical protein